METPWITTPKNAIASNRALFGDFVLLTHPVDKNTVKHLVFIEDSKAEFGSRKALETWRRETKLSNSSRGSVWLERCDDIQRDGAPSVRAVKKIKLSRRQDFHALRQLEAMCTFSQKEVIPATSPSSLRRLSKH